MTQENVSPKRGRRRGGEDTRELILSAARELFAESSFEGVSLRQIARHAGVDSALVHHYFESKEALFTACVELPADPLAVLATVAHSSPEQRAESLIRAVLGLWDSSARPALLALVNSAISSPLRASLVRQVMNRLLMPQVTAGLDGSPAELRLRGNLVISQLLGVIVARHVVKIEPLASASITELVHWTAPTIQRYLTGEITQEPNSDDRNGQYSPSQPESLRP
ncbi:TetR family transcriptional regulator [Psychromicrobium lacuslunae]|uniref:TetR/AcrR family transcriptional regulator n=1 Tax=Psychromicrobium lacuslunae TaxID=1618207 RepID=UPI0005D3BB65|nr:TetR family transcriptional regulator [Psychromicrobium lacuslunae]